MQLIDLLNCFLAEKRASITTAVKHIEARLTTPPAFQRQPSLTAGQVRAIIKRRQLSAPSQLLDYISHSAINATVYYAAADVFQMERADATRIVDEHRRENNGSADWVEALRKLDGAVTPF